jgi:hypothetical protein
MVVYGVLLLACGIFGFAVITALLNWVIQLRCRSGDGYCPFLMKEKKKIINVILSRSASSKGHLYES